MGALQVAILDRMRADVDVGYLLSGGLDSSAVAALAQSKQREPIHTFSVAVDAPGFDESSWSRQVAGELGSHHHELRLGADVLEPTLDQLTRCLDEPLADSSLVVTWKLMEHVRATGFKSVMSGDGADESFAGYPTCLAHRIVEKLPAVAPLGELLRPALRHLPVSSHGVSRDYMMRRFMDGMGLPWARRHQVWMGAWLPSELDVVPTAWREVDAHAHAAHDTDPVSRCLYLDQRLYLADGVLVKMDRASMAHGVEVRSPFMDHSVVELAAAMTPRMKLHGRQTKLVLRRAVRDLVPGSVLERPKKGFGTPVGPWLRGPCRHLLEDLPESTEGWIPSDLLRRVIDEHLAGTTDHRRRLWSALVLARWREGPWGPG
jgi:asparagine synthase (glutamine-hydrolysing)